jgi:hypothetical protein
MATHAHRILLLLALAAAAPAALAAAPASGKVKFEGESWNVADAIAYRPEKEILVVLGAAAFDRKAFAEDGKLDDFDFLRQGVSTITLKIADDGSMNCLDFSSHHGGGSSCGTVGAGLKLTARDAKHVAGSFKYSSGQDAVDVSFDLPISPTQMARAGTPLPAGGGDPGKALMATLQAIQSGDLAKIKAVSNPAKLGEIQKAEKSGEAKEMVEMMKAFTPKITKIPGGSIDGDSAVLDFIGEEDGAPIKGTVTMSRSGGKWYMDSINTSN